MQRALFLRYVVLAVLMLTLLCVGKTAKSRFAAPPSDYQEKTYFFCQNISFQINFIQARKDVSSRRDAPQKEVPAYKGPKKEKTCNTQRKDNLLVFKRL